MDLKKFDSITNADKGMDLVLEEATKDNPGAALVLYGADSAVMREKDREIQRRNAEKRGTISTKEAEDQMFERLVTATKTWRGIVEGGKEIAFSPKEAERIYRSYPEIADMATRFIFNRANFFTTASAS